MKPASLLLLVLTPIAEGRADLAPDPEQGWRYTLLEGSSLTDDCPVCGRPTIVVPMRGSFTLRRLDEDPLFTTYALDDIAFTAGSGAGSSYTVTGTGTLRIGGEVAVTQEGSMHVGIDNGIVNTDALLASAIGPRERLWPMIQVTVRQTNGTLLQVYDLTLAAAPIREAWYSTGGRFTSGTRPPPDNSISGGDLISSSGRIVRRNEELTRRLGIMPIVPDLGLDAFDMQPGGTVVFSIETDAFSESLGPLQAGDGLIEDGRILWTNQSLLSAFGVQPPVPDAGLDALQFFPDAVPPAGARAGETWFSIVKDQFSEKLGRTLRAGDILSNDGKIVRTHEQLLQRFGPVDPKADHGLDALYVWPSGEIWFSTERGFTGEGSTTYLGGDVLSDQGYVVFRNLDLLGPFAPIEDRMEFGLDALWVVTDVMPAGQPPQLTAIEIDRASGTLRLAWQGGGRVFQVEGREGLTDPWETLSPIVPDREFLDVGVLFRLPRRFYRIRQW